MAAGKHLTVNDKIEELSNVDAGIANQYVKWDGTAANVISVASIPSTDITGLNTANWDTAFSWGDHALAGYQTGTSGANTALDNLTTTAINLSLLPDTSNSLSLGSSNRYWQIGHFGDVRLYDDAGADAICIQSPPVLDETIATPSWIFRLPPNEGLVGQTLEVIDITSRIATTEWRDVKNLANVDQVLTGARLINANAGELSIERTGLGEQYALRLVNKSGTASGDSASLAFQQHPTSTITGAIHSDHVGNLDYNMRFQVWSDIGNVLADRLILKNLGQVNIPLEPALDNLEDDLLAILPNGDIVRRSAISVTGVSSNLATTDQPLTGNRIISGVDNITRYNLLHIFIDQFGVNANSFDLNAVGGGGTAGLNLILGEARLTGDVIKIKHVGVDGNGLYIKGTNIDGTIAYVDINTDIDLNTNVINGATAFGWGDHSLAGYSTIDGLWGTDANGIIATGTPNIGIGGASTLANVLTITGATQINDGNFAMYDGVGIRHIFYPGALANNQIGGNLRVLEGKLSAGAGATQFGLLNIGNSTTTVPHMHFDAGVDVTTPTAGMLTWNGTELNFTTGAGAGTNVDLLTVGTGSSGIYGTSDTIPTLHTTTFGFGSVWDITAPDDAFNKMNINYKVSTLTAELRMGTSNGGGGFPATNFDGQGNGTYAHRNSFGYKTLVVNGDSSSFFMNDKEVVITGGQETAYSGAASFKFRTESTPNATIENVFTSDMANNVQAQFHSLQFGGNANIVFSVNSETKTSYGLAEVTNVIGRHRFAGDVGIDGGLQIKTTIAPIAGQIWKTTDIEGNGAWSNQTIQYVEVDEAITGDATGDITSPATINSTFVLRTLANAPANIAVDIMVGSDTGANASTGVRAVGSARTLLVKQDTDRAYVVTVQTNASSQIEIFSNSATQDFTYLGHSIII